MTEKHIEVDVTLKFIDLEIAALATINEARVAFSAGKYQDSITLLETSKTFYTILLDGMKQTNEPDMEKSFTDMLATISHCMRICASYQKLQNNSSDSKDALVDFLNTLFPDVPKEQEEKDED